MSKKSVLLFAPWFFPGFKAGGIIHAVVNFVDAMQEDLDIWIVTSDRDSGDLEPYPGIESDCWQSYSKSAKIRYLSKKELGPIVVFRVIKTIRPNFIYINGMFSLYYAIYPLLISLLYSVNTRVVLCPHGMLQSGALKYKALKKQLYLKLLKLNGLHKSILFQASNNEEKQDINLTFGDKARINIAPVFAKAPFDLKLCEKKPNELNLIFVSRISPKKNLIYVLDLLAGLSKHLRVVLNIYGYVDDTDYWTLCEQQIRDLPGNISVNIKEAIPNNQVHITIQKNHLFVLPTYGENFGYAIYESLASGRPVMISNNTPWHDLEVWNAGFAYPLDNPHLFLDSLESLASMGQTDFDQLCHNSYNYARNYYDGQNAKTLNQNLFN